MTRSRRLAALVLLAGATGTIGAAIRAHQQAAPAAPIPSPLGTPTENGLAGFAKILCSAVFVSGRDAGGRRPGQRLLLHAARPSATR